MSSINLTRKEMFTRIKYFLKKKRMTATDLSRELGHEKTYLSRVERGVIEFNFSTFYAILDYLNITTFEFFYPDLEGFNDDINFLDLYKSLPDEEKHKLYRNIYLKIHTN